MLWILLIYYLRNEYNSLATKAANGKRCNHDKEKASQIKVMRQWLENEPDLFDPVAIQWIKTFEWPLDGVKFKVTDHRSKEVKGDGPESKLSCKSWPP